MAFFVAVRQQVQPDRLDAILATMRGDFSTSRQVHPGRRQTRVFHRLNAPHDLLAIGEWDSEADYLQLRQTDRYQAATVQADPPATIEHLKRLRLYAQISAPPVVIGCLTFEAPAENRAALEAYMLGPVSEAVERSPGLTSHEVYRVGEDGSRLLVVHWWRSLDDLERFRTGVRRQFDPTLEALGVTVERWTGVVAAEYSRFDA